MLMITQMQTPQKSHHIRTFFAGLAGTLAISLILLSIMVVWLNRTLTDTATYVSTVAPLASKPAIQTFVASKISMQIVQSAPQQDIAVALLPASSITPATTPDQLQAMLMSVVTTNVMQIVESPKFAELWKSTNQSLHASLVAQLNSAPSDQLTLDMTPTLSGVVDLLKSTQLAPVADQMNIAPGSGVVTMKNSKIVQFHQYYVWFKDGTIVIVVLALVLAVAAVLLSVHHNKILRRILLGVGVVALVEAAFLWLPSVAPIPAPDRATLDAARAMEQVIVQNLLVANLVIGIVCILAALGSKLYEKLMRKSQT